MKKMDTGKIRVTRKEWGGWGCGQKRGWGSKLLRGCKWGRGWNYKRKGMLSGLREH